VNIPTTVIYDLLRALLAMEWELVSAGSPPAIARVERQFTANAGKAISNGSGLMNGGHWIPGGAKAFNHLRSDPGVLTQAKIRELLALLCQQLDDNDRSAYDASLVDLMAKFLREDRWQPNRLHGESFQTLRRAILIPSELAQLDQQLRNTFVCTACGTRLEHGVLSTLIFGDASGPEARCVRCAPPLASVCPDPTCKEIVPLTEEQQMALAKALPACPAHGGQEVARPRQRGVPAAGPRANRGVGAFVQALRQQPAPMVDFAIPVEPEEP
jgi:hypothetical protein